MEPLQSTKFALGWFCLYPVVANDSSFKWIKLARIVILPTISISCLSMDIACFTFIYEYFSTNLDDCLLTILAAIVCIATLYTMLIAFRSRHEIASVIDQLSTIYDDRKYFELNFFQFLAKSFRLF